jgi:5-methylcytosine-specific restriction endonuclease McrA
MKRILAKHISVRLDTASYAALRVQILTRDGWKCQNCGRKDRLEVHHKEFRSHAGEDSEENLITLCIICHSDVHGRRRSPSRRLGS